MKIDPSVLRKLRDERSWTQEHLAGVSGVSLRTIQRIEREGSTSADTRLALAAAFAVDVSLLAGKPEAPSANPSHHPEPAAEPETGTSGQASFFLRHAFVYVAVCSFLVYRDWSANGGLVWAYWPLLGWGFGLAMHGWRTLVRAQHHSIRRNDPSRPTRPGNAYVEKIAIYLVMSVFFVVLDVSRTGRLTWCFYPILGWGAGLFLFGHGRKSTARSG